jgi:hypothetical protein
MHNPFVRPNEYPNAGTENSKAQYPNQGAFQGTAAGSNYNCLQDQHAAGGEQSESSDKSEYQSSGGEPGRHAATNSADFATDEPGSTRIS